MATISKYYKKAITDLLATKPLYCCLMKNTHTISAGDHYYADISANECSGTAYTAGGIPLSTLASSQVGDNAKFTAASAVFAGVTLTAMYAVVYDVITGAIVSEHSLGGDKAVTGGTLTLVWNTNGILSVS
jgi:hypothetical protein